MAVFQPQAKNETPNRRLPGTIYDRPRTEQYRLKRLQLYNWGTFQDYHDLKISDEGFLITGHSGSGKTTILDAISTMLIPKKFIEYNWAARDVKRRDRTLESYVKGAWNAQSDEQTGEVKINFLRDRTTWSAIAMTYGRRGAELLTLLQIFWLTRSGQAEAKRHYLILERGLELSELSFGELDLSVPRLLEKLGDYWHESRDFPSYCERFRQRLGIANETTLRLLQKTQSMKNIEDLHSFLTEYMIEPPKTFETANELCADFGNLKVAYDAVVTAERQVALLTRIEEALERFGEAGRRLKEAETLQAHLDAYVEFKAIDLCLARIEELKAEEEERRKIELEIKGVRDEAREKLESLKDDRRRTGGERIEKWERALQDWSLKLDERRRVCAKVRGAFKILDWPFKDGEQAYYQSCKKRAGEELESVKGDRRRLRPRQELLAFELLSLRERLKAAEDELSELKKRPGNIPASLTLLRDRLAGQLGVPREALPFAGELLGVKAEEERWRPAIERALSDLAQSLVVEDPLVPELAKAALRTSLGGRLSWISAPVREKGAPEEGPWPEEGSLAGKLSAKKGFQWVIPALFPRLDFACLEDPAELGFHFKAVTVGGLVKVDEELFFKDDRVDPLDDLSRILGFDNKAKTAAYERLRKRLSEEEREKSRELTAVYDLQADLEDREGAYGVVLSVDWQDLDTWWAQERVAEAKKAIKGEKEGNQALKEIDREIKAQLEAIKELEERWEEAVGERREVISARLRAAQIREGLRQSRHPEIPVEAMPFLEKTLSERGELTLDNFNKLRFQAKSDLWERSQGLVDQRVKSEAALLRDMAEFKKSWPEAMADLEPAVGYAPEFVNLLRTLERDALPGHRKNFSDLLSTQTRNHLVTLKSRFGWEREEMTQRLKLVNESLAGLVYGVADGRESTLRLRMDARESAEVSEFKAKLKALTGDDLFEGRQTQEEFFIKVQSLVAKLSDPNRDSWRRKVLDTRDHVRFTGIELDEGGKEIERYQSGSGKSGGQRQKLAAICLAAALRYQLGAQSLGYPVYGLVVFDEAFDKLDSDSTMVVMKIFKELGFQMILATPLKGILAAEPYIGGATVVSIYDRQRSFFTEIDYDSGSKHLLRESLAAALAGAGEGEPGKAGEAPEAALRAAREEPEGTQGEAGPPGSSEAGSSSDLASSPEAVSEPLETAREEPEGSQRNDPSGSLEASGGLSGPSRGPLEDETGPAEGQGPLEPQDAQEG